MLSPQLGLLPATFCEGESDKENGSNVPVYATKQSPRKYEGDVFRSRVCTFDKGPAGFGFSFSSSPKNNGTFISKVRMKYCVPLNQYYIVTESRVSWFSFFCKVCIFYYPVGDFWRSSTESRTA